MKMIEIILTVQSYGNKKYRLGINTKNSKEYFKKRHLEIILKLDNISFQTGTKCGCINSKINCNKRKKGYDLSDIKINNWIIKNNFQRYKKRKPTKLIFSFDEDKLILIFEKKFI